MKRARVHQLLFALELGAWTMCLLFAVLMVLVFACVISCGRGPMPCQPRPAVIGTGDAPPARACTVPR